MAFRLVEGYLPGAAKGCCYVCNSSQRRVGSGAAERNEWVLDTGVVIDFEGNLNVCESCLREGAHLLGLVDAAEVTRLEAVAADASERADAVAAERDDALRVADEVLAYRAAHAPAKIPEPAAAPTPAPARGTTKAAKAS